MLSPFRLLVHFLRLCLSGFSYLIRHPVRSFAVALLLALIGGGVGMAGFQLWANYHLRAARSAVEHYHDTEAMEHLAAYIRARPEDGEGLLLSARVARRLEAFEQAEQFLNTYRSLYGEDDNLILERVLLRAATGDVDEISRFAKKLVEQDSSASSLILEAFVHGYLYMYRLDEASYCLKLWLDREPDNPQAHWYQGLRYEQGGHTQEALTSYRRAVEIDAERDDARQHWAAILVQMRQSEEALPHLEYVAQRHPENLTVQVNLARCQDDRGQQAAAVEILDRILADHPDYPPAVAERGRLAYQAGQMSEAEKWLRRAATLQPGDRQTHYLLSQCLLRRGKSEESKQVDARIKQIEDDIRAIEQIVNGRMQKSPHDPALHYEAGMIALRAGALQDGLRWLHSALKVDPNYVPAHRALAYYYLKTGDTARAARHGKLAQQAADEGRNTKYDERGKG
jgi:tetratricopeptide (TPR) repeat protein